MALTIGNTHVNAVYVGSTPVRSVYVGSKLVWSATVQITLGTGNQARDQFRAALTERGLDHATITEVPFEIELVGTGSAQNMFESCWELESVPNLDTSGVTNMSSMFAYCQSITHVPDMDTSNVTDMSNMFSTCSELTHAPAMDTSNVTDMYAMFSGCGLLTHVPDMDTSKVTNMNYMFFVCTSLTDGNVRLIGRNPYVSTDSMISVTGLTREPWYRADGTPLEVVQITMSSTYNARNEFRAALSDRGLAYRTVTEIPFDIELVGTTGAADYLFDGCRALTTPPTLNTSGVTSMERMFQDCAALTHAPDMDTSNVTSMLYMFRSCGALTSVPDMDTSSVTNMGNMFDYCSSLTDGNVRLIGKHPNVITTNMIRNSGLTYEPWHTVGDPPDGVHEVTLSNVYVNRTANPLVHAIPPIGETWSVRIQGTVTNASATESSKPFFRIGTADSGRYGQGATVDFSGTVTSANSTIGMVTGGVMTSFVGTVTIET